MQRHRFGEMRHRGLGRVICGKVALGADAAHRRHVDHRPAMILHLRDDMLAAQKDPVDVDRKFVAKCLERQVLDRPMGGDPGIVDEDVEALAGAERGKPFGFLRHVELDEALAEFGGQRLARRDVDVGNDDACTLGGEAADDVEAQSRRAAGHERDLARNAALPSHPVLPLLPRHYHAAGKAMGLFIALGAADGR
jgi:hypothetical protein